MTVFIGLAIALALLLAAGPATGAPPRCRIVPAAEARLRLDIWGRELTGTKGRIVAHSARRIAWVADRQGTVLEALFLVALQDASAPARFAERPPRPKWVRCTWPEADPWR